MAAVADNASAYAPEYNYEQQRLDNIRCTLRVFYSQQAQLSVDSCSGSLNEEFLQKLLLSQSNYEGERQVS